MGNCFSNQISPVVSESESNSNSPLSEMKELQYNDNKVDMIKLNQQQIREIYNHEARLFKIY